MPMPMPMLMPMLILGVKSSQSQVCYGLPSRNTRQHVLVYMLPS